MRQDWGWRFAGVAALGLALAGCSNNGGSFSPTFMAPRVEPHTSSGPEKASEKIIQLPASAADVACPEVDVFDGGATARVGGPANQDVRYQFDISDVARECDPQGKMFSLKVGVAGRLLIGPAGSPGDYSTTLHVKVKRDIDEQVLFDKTYRVAVDTKGADQAPYRIVTDPIMLPLTRARLDMDYSIFVGLGAGGEKAVAHRRKRHKG
jgi:hypothetical protein